jgi:U3 small nucleolar RNA-associated protein 21
VTVGSAKYHTSVVLKNTLNTHQTNISDCNSQMTSLKVENLVCSGLLYCTILTISGNSGQTTMTGFQGIIFTLFLASFEVTKSWTIIISSLHNCISGTGAFYLKAERLWCVLSSTMARSSSIDAPPPSVDDEDSTTSDASLSDKDPPQPVTSDDDEEHVPPAPVTTGSSRLLAPYRSVGYVTSGAPFDFVSHENSQDSVACVPLGDRFQLVSTNKLEPVLVSQSLGARTRISHCINDSNLRITLTCATVARNYCQVTLWKRTQAVQHKVFSHQWKTVAMLHLGCHKVSMKGENGINVEKAVLFCLVQSKRVNDDDDEGQSEDVLVGYDEDDESGDELSVADEEEHTNSRGRVVVMVATRSHVTVQKLIPLEPLSFRPFTAVHPVTYLNKLCLGGVYTDTKQPGLILINVRSSKLIHKFVCIPSGECMLTALEQSPAVDTVAVGTSHGYVHLVNLRHDKLLFSLCHRNSSESLLTIQSLSFRTDASALQYAIAPLAVGRSDGVVSVWDLTPQDDDRRELLTEFLAHPGGIARILYIPHEPLLLSTGTQSNAMLLHIFDNPDHSGRVLKSRRGHSSPPTRIQYVHPGTGGVLAHAGDAQSCQIISSGGNDRTLRVFSTARTVFDKEYSQGAGLEKRARQLGLEKAELLLPPVIDFFSCEARSRDWGDLVTIHQDHAMAYVWSHRRASQSGPVLRQDSWNVSAMKLPPPVSVHATSVTISPCGNFCVVGTKGGTIYKYNVQSGLPRGAYPVMMDDGSKIKRNILPGDVRRTFKEIEKSGKMSSRAPNLDKRELDAERNAKVEAQRAAKLKSASHSGTVTGLAIDSLNKTLISVGSDSKLIMWNFSTHAPYKNSPYQLPKPATKLRHVRESDLAAIALNDYSVVLFDCVASTIVRRFKEGHNGSISGIDFSPDGRLLYTSSLDHTIRVWDVPTNNCVDWLGFKSAVTSVAVSPTGEFLATTHQGQLGINIWSDRSYYQTVHFDSTVLTSPVAMDDPTPLSQLSEKRTSDSTDDIVDETSRVNVDASEDGITTGPVMPLKEGLITLSGLPQAHWKNLFHLELVKERNKPKEAPKKPPTAPFFLQWRSGETLDDQPSSHRELESEDAHQKEWAAVWSDEDEEGEKEITAKLNTTKNTSKRGAELKADQAPIKRRKTAFSRSHLSSLLTKCISDKSGFGSVTEYIGTLGPSRIDLELSSLCRGDHDLDEGLDLLKLACLWLEEATMSRERYEAVNAYTHRFLYLHGATIARIESLVKGQEIDKEGLGVSEDLLLCRKQEEVLHAITQLREAQVSSSEALQSKMQHTLCLLRHFSRMI